MRLPGLVLIVIVLLVPSFWFFKLAGQYPAVALFSQYLGAAALIAMGMAQILAARLPGSEMVFGGLDRIYLLHKWLAVFAMVCLGLHDVIDAEIDGLGRETLLMDIAEDVGEIALYGLLILVFVTLTTFIPYIYWRWSHQFIGVFFALGVFHYLFIQKPFHIADPLSLYILFFCVAGILSYLYMVLIYRRIPGPARYRVSETIAYEGATEIVLTPLNKAIRHRAGQFAFFGFDQPELAEIHPFTISGAPSDSGELRICVKALGRYTRALTKQIKPEMPVRVFGAFGRFRLPQVKDQQIWIGAGIGITPFMAWVRSFDAAHPGHRVHLYYSVRSDGNVPFVNELRALADGDPNFQLTVHNSGRQGRLTATDILRDHEPHMATAYVSFCGPEALANQMRSELVKAGLKPSRFLNEEFEIRSSIGLLKIAQWLLKRIR